MLYSWWVGYSFPYLSSLASMSSALLLRPQHLQSPSPVLFTCGSSCTISQLHPFFPRPSLASRVSRTSWGPCWLPSPLSGPHLHFFPHPLLLLRKFRCDHRASLLKIVTSYHWNQDAFPYSPARWMQCLGSLLTLYIDSYPAPPPRACSGAPYGGAPK